MPLHLKAGDGDLLVITKPALLTRCAWSSHLIICTALFIRLHRLSVSNNLLGALVDWSVCLCRWSSGDPSVPGAAGSAAVEQTKAAGSRTSRCGPEGSTATANTGCGAAKGTSPASVILFFLMNHYLYKCAFNISLLSLFISLFSWARSRPLRPRANSSRKYTPPPLHFSLPLRPSSSPPPSDSHRNLHSRYR